MKKSELTKLREKSADELSGMATELRESLLKGRFAAALEGKGMGIKTRGTRRQIARIETLLSQRPKGSAPVTAVAQPATRVAATKPAAKTAESAAKSAAKSAKSAATSAAKSGAKKKV